MTRFVFCLYDRCSSTRGICRIGKSVSLLHVLHVLVSFFFLIYLFITLSIYFHLYSNQQLRHAPYLSPSCLSPLPHYQLVPISSIYTACDRIPRILLANASLVTKGLQCFALPLDSTTPSRTRSFRHARFLFILLLLLAGDVNLNPGPNISQSLHFSHFNIRSASSITPDLNKPAALQDFLLTQNIDILALSETWLSSDSPPSILNSLTPPDFSLIHVPRQHRTGGGLALVYRSTLNVSLISLPSFLSFEAMCTRVSLPSTSLLLLNIYHPPSCSKANFISDFSTLLEDLVSQPSELLITGDFNFHVNAPVPSSDTHFLTLLDTFSLTQHVDFPTHTSLHTLDLLITRSSSNLISIVTCADPGLSDHLALLCTLSIPTRTMPSRITKSIRSFRSINTVAFAKDIQSSSLTHSPANSVEAYLDQFNSTLSLLLDKHAPLKTVSCVARTHKPFITEEIRKEKSKRSKLETLYRRTHSPINFHNFKTQSRLVAKLITSSRRTYFKSLISNSAKQPKKLWSALNSLLSRSSPNILPSTSSPASLATSFCDFFSDKITKLSATFPSNAALPQDSNSFPYPCLSNFSPASSDEVRTIILNSPNATCSLDIIPTFLLKACLDSLLSPITNIINYSLTEGIFPTKFKHAIVIPKLKKHSLPQEELSSYRPISNLNFISKILERIISARINCHLKTFPSLSPCQSAYRKFHSTETALLKISNDLLIACNEQKVTALILLDLTAAFDTIDYRILLSRLSSTFGITDMAHNLLSSYLQNRSQSVIIGTHSSAPCNLCTGVPQGSVLGPLLFCLYTTPLTSIFDNSPVSSHFYADDSQCYISFSSTDSPLSLAKLSSTLDSTYEWLTLNRLCLNPSKTEYLLIGTPQQRSKILSSSINFRGINLTPSSDARNLGVIFDSNLSFNKHISNICSSSFYQIRQLRQIRSSLDTNSAIVLANALVTSKLDYCNSLLYSLPATAITRLQRVQNALARVVVPTARYGQHITPTLEKLHWLPISKRITFKIAALTFKTLL